ncbi:glycerol-3-phosphate dehydrogenase [Duganella sp. CF402]|uniref:glycerol-3-phosphate dehydrogenase n=1 Tax=unclassified Duganella TaxID=2636909 RepID=UPI0008AED82D|nr:MULTISPECIES: glycerol-3-phosphate dehydrogenase [unclassified Duganella]RZT10737.1 homodimeric glycerol 3-phosphate dehydrogenase (quinone) [Duganella sp. BK701]SEK99293.1 glycerol-3-phosphate dehydrogenase [Duganella sp. CF402]
MAEPQHILDCDVLIIGGGINGAGIARDAAGRGLSVVLCEKDDLASHTSSASTKLIHGGLRYLEYYEFNLVRKALIEREVLLRAAPHIMWPLRFVMPHAQGQRPAWMIRAGLFLYDMLARRELLPASAGINLRSHVAGKPLKSEFTRGFIYSDGWVDDARLVVLNAIDACEKGATILTQAVCQKLERKTADWEATLFKPSCGEIRVNARYVVNAAGPWTAGLLQSALPKQESGHLRLIKGSHIVVKRIFEHDNAYIFQHPDGRIVFAIPYERDFTLIGTTDLDYQGDANSVAISQDEISYLCGLASQYFTQPITPADVVWTYSGVRPLVEDGADAKAVTRDYRLEVDDDGPPILSVFGGKITTFRKLAEEAVDQIAKALDNRHGSWTHNACLPGGDLFGAEPHNRSVLEFSKWQEAQLARYSGLPSTLVTRYCRTYGTRIHTLLADRTDVASLGDEIAPGLYATEVEYLRRYEWARTAQDILWRRTKLGLHLPADAAAHLQTWLTAHPLAR